MREFVDKQGRVWPQVIANQCGPSELQERVLLARELGCQGCIFWHRHWYDLRGSYGACKRRAPQFPPREDMVHSYQDDDEGLGGGWPATDETDWCGEFVANRLDESPPA